MSGMQENFGKDGQFPTRDQIDECGPFDSAHVSNTRAPATEHVETSVDPHSYDASWHRMLGVKGVMALRRIFERSISRLREISKVTTAYEVSLIELGITDRTDPRAEIIASAIIHRASTGGLDIRTLVDFAKAQIASEDDRDRSA
jgi:hypothetical protein